MRLTVDENSQLLREVWPYRARRVVSAWFAEDEAVGPLGYVQPPNPRAHDGVAGHTI
jgi:hypothetical protein